MIQHRHKRLASHNTHSRRTKMLNCHSSFLKRYTSDFFAVFNSTSTLISCQRCSCTHDFYEVVLLWKLLFYEPVSTAIIEKWELKEQTFKFKPYRHEVARRVVKLLKKEKKRSTDSDRNFGKTQRQRTYVSYPKYKCWQNDTCESMLNTYEIITFEAPTTRVCATTAAKPSICAPRSL